MQKLKPYLLPLFLVLFSRILNVLFLMSAARSQTFKPSLFPAEPDGVANYLDVISNWDAFWYYTIATSGYPEQFPTINNEIVQSPWSFYPLWGECLKIFSSLTNLSLPISAVILTSLFFAMAIVVIYKLFLQYSNKTLATVVIVWLCFAPNTAVFQIAYSESLALFLLALGFYWTLETKYWKAAIVFTLLSLTRPIMLPVGVTLILTSLFYLYSKKEKTRNNYRLLLLGIYGVVSFCFWPLYCAFRTGYWDGYLKAQKAWLKYGTDNGLVNIFTEPKFWLPTLSLIIFILCLFVFAKKTEMNLMLKLWVIIYFIYITVTIRVGSYSNDRYLIDEKTGDIVLNYSLYRYYLLTFVPIIPLHLIAKINNKNIRLFIYGILSLATLALTFLFTQNVVAQTGKLAFP